MSLLNLSHARAQYFVATTGSDANPGTLDAPFLTLQRAQNAMRRGTVKTTYIRAGLYTLPVINNCAQATTSCGLDLNEKDNGETWSYYPPDGPGSADFNARATNAGSGLSVAIHVDNTRNVTIDGLSIHNFRVAAIASTGGTANLTIRNNTLFNGFKGTGAENTAAAISCYGCNATSILNNVIHDVAAFGINNVNVNGNISNFTVAGNVIYRACLKLSDCAAIYAQDLTATATNIQIVNNFVRDGNVYAPLDTGYGAGIYADDCLSNVSIRGNVLTGRNGSNTLLTHGGSNVAISQNLIDLATYRQSAAAWQTSDGAGCASAAMTGDSFTHNVIISAGGGGGFALLSGVPANAPAIMANAYWSYGSDPVSTVADFSDAVPVQQNPMLSCWTYDLGSQSPVRAAPVNFVPPAGKWGPPGYAIPHTGTPPSSPHGC